MTKKLLHSLVAVGLCLLPLLAPAQEEQDLVTSEDLDLVIGQWQGNLTYTDYTTGEPYSMPANASISAGKKPGVILINISYPDEPHANNSSKMVISKDGTRLNKQTVVSRFINPSGDIEIITEESGKDNNQKATIRHTYILGEKRFIDRKEVRYADQDSWLVRNEYSYRRID